MDYQQIEKIYKALANRRRLAILAHINSTGQANVGDIANEINLSIKATSKHLQVLKNAGMVHSKQISLEQHYSINKTNIYLKRALLNL